tara:strand:+ start:7520 stop:8218 length:699 start_codon:yes stop_codon:yes gene_type:complete
MVRIDRVHTGGGDSGESSLVDGSRRSKSDARFSVVGDCDELNSLLGVARMECARVPMRHRDGGDRKGAGRVHFICDSALSRVQHELFDLGAELACPPQNLPEYMALINEDQSEVLVSDMDAWLSQTEPLTSFILPAGGPPQAMLHHARTVARRLERNIVALRDIEGEGSVRPLALTYVNRLSDWLFVLSRWITAVLGEEEMLWLPLGKRGKEDGIADSIHRQNENDSEFDEI